MSDPCPACGRKMLRFMWDDEESSDVLFVFKMICDGCHRVEEHRHGGGLILDDAEGDDAGSLPNRDRSLG